MIAKIFRIIFVLDVLNVSNAKQPSFVENFIEIQHNTALNLSSSYTTLCDPLINNMMQ